VADPFHLLTKPPLANLQEVMRHFKKVHPASRKPVNSNDLTPVTPTPFTLKS
jgi:hypothetical protein